MRPARAILYLRRSPMPEAAKKLKRKSEARIRLLSQPPLDWPLAIIVLTLVVFGLVMLFSASYATAYYRFKGDSFHFIRQPGAVRRGGRGRDVRCVPRGLPHLPQICVAHHGRHGRTAHRRALHAGAERREAVDIPAHRRQSAALGGGEVRGHRAVRAHHFHQP